MTKQGTETLAIALLAVILNSCTGDSETGGAEKLFTLLPESETNAGFVNHLDFNKQLEMKFNIYTYRNFYNGGGVALGDINNDGLIDIFLTSNMEDNMLYLNKGDMKFEDITAKAGIRGKGKMSTGVSFADVNGDGWTDIYICNSGNIRGDDRRNELYINNGNLTFSEKAAEHRIDDPGFSTHGQFFDYDKDGDLDLYLMNNSSRAIGSFDLKMNLRTQRDSLGGDKLFRNDGDYFTDVSEAAGIYGSIIGFGLGITIGDVNLDGWMDIYVSNDFFERDYLYINNHDGTFTENLTAMMKSISAASMGADMADINNDMYPDIFATDMVPEHNDRLKTKTTFDSWESYKAGVENDYHHQFTRNMLQLNNGDGTYSEIGRFAGVNATDWSWGALIADLDNDGRKDLFVANGIYKDLTDQDYIQYFSNRDMVMSIVAGNNVDYKTLIEAIPSVRIPNYAFRNMGNLRFENMAESWGLGEPGFSNGSAYGDLDNDGDLDLVINNVNMPVSIYRNDASELHPENRFLKIILKGLPGNTQAIGAKVIAWHNDSLFYLEQMPMRGYLSTSDPRPNLGLGRITALDSLVVVWPDDRVTSLEKVTTNQTLTLDQQQASSDSRHLVRPHATAHLLFEDVSSRKIVDFTHREASFNDFERDPLLYHMLSTEGPRMCKGDLDNNGFDDIFICGAKDQPGALYMQLKNGTFERSNTKLFEADIISEDTDCAMFDADRDGDLDLYVTSGGNELPETSSALADRLYLNDGRGKLSKSDQVLPAGRYESSSCVKPCDFDNDGDIELFVGTRLKPFLYGVPVNGYLLENNGKGEFSDATPRLAPGLSGIGMIRDMAWADVDGDGDKDMIIAGEWMPIKVFINNNGTFSEHPGAFSERTEGWWNCIETGDIDGDGDIDFVAGNHGLNSRFKASELKPVIMYVNDFDLNGTAEQIICTFDGDTAFPLALRHDLVNQIPSLGNKYRKYADYRHQTINHMFSAEHLENAIKLEACLLETSLFINDGKGRFARKVLPGNSQYSPVYAAEIHDFNSDGKQDIIMGGNLYSAKPETGRYDASYGTFLSGRGNGEFDFIPGVKSGFHIDGEIRDFLDIGSAGRMILLVSKSNNSLQVLRTNK